MKKIPFFLMMLALAGGMVLSGCKKKEGCTDPASLNYDPDAEVDDGSCQYDDPNATDYVDNGDGTITVTDHGQGTGTITWTAAKEYILDGFVFVNSGQTLTIEAGTVVRGKPGTGENASALIVARGGKIFANGTAADPIIMTALNDNLASTTDIPLGTAGLWGGLMVLGSAKLNSTPGETAIEGIPTTEGRGLYGGTNDADNSGSITYVSVRYGGTDIGAGNEINGVTFGGVGSGTVVDHVEVMFNADDGFEFFGGTVQTKHLAAVFCGDDAFDYDEGFRGNGQFWFAIQGTVGGVATGDRGGEHDGGTTPEDGSPYAHPIIYNATYIGGGSAAGKRTLTLRDNAGGEYHNSIFMEYGKGADIELLASGQDSYDRYLAGELKLENNVFWNISGNDPIKVFAITVGSGVLSADSLAADTDVKAYFGTANNSVADPGIVVSYTNDGTLNPVPSTPPAAGPAPVGAFFDNVTYKGAFGSSNWLAGWSGADAIGFF